MSTIKNINGGRYKGYLWYKKRWLSICSAHWEYQNECNMCKAGFWKNVWAYKIDRLFEEIKKIIIPNKESDGQ